MVGVAEPRDKAVLPRAVTEAFRDGADGLGGEPLSEVRGVPEEEGGHEKEEQAETERVERG